MEKNELDEACRAYGEERCIQVLVGKPKGKSPFKRTMHRWENNIKIDIQEVGCGGIDWIELAENRDRCWALMNAVTNLRVPLNAGNFLTG
jgi:hypothetical protein